MDTADHSPSDNLLGDGFDILIGADDHGRIVGQLLRYSKVVIFDGLNGMLAETCVGQIIHDDGGTFYGAL